MYLHTSAIHHRKLMHICINLNKYSLAMISNITFSLLPENAMHLFHKLWHKQLQIVHKCVYAHLSLNKQKTNQGQKGQNQWRWRWYPAVCWLVRRSTLQSVWICFTRARVAKNSCDHTQPDGQIDTTQVQVLKHLHATSNKLLTYCVLRLT